MVLWSVPPQLRGKCGTKLSCRTSHFCYSVTLQVQEIPLMKLRSPTRSKCFMFATDYIKSVDEKFVVFLNLKSIDMSSKLRKQLSVN